MSTKQELLEGSRATDEVWIDALSETVRIRKMMASEASEASALAVGGQTMKISPRRRQLGVREAKAAAERARMDPEAPAIEADPDGGELSFDLAESQRSQFASDCMVAAAGLSVDETWTTAEVERLPPGAPEEIARAVRAFSRIGGEELIKQFRVDHRRSSGSDDSPDGGSAGGDAG